MQFFVIFERFGAHGNFEKNEVMFGAIFFVNNRGLINGLESPNIKFTPGFS
jgi:hypothetical protein